MFFGKALNVSINIMPMTILMMKVVPKNIEASMFAVITAAITFSYDWGADFVGAIVCKTMGITKENMSQFKNAILFQLFMNIASCYYIYLLPSEDQIKEIQEKIELEES
jgi:hypothetical protein